VDDTELDINEGPTIRKELELRTSFSDTISQDPRPALTHSAVSAVEQS
jgi:hypothetical protein